MTSLVRNEDAEEQLRGLTEGPETIRRRDVLEVVESVMASISRDGPTGQEPFLAEIEELAGYINKAKLEIAAINPDKVSSEYLPQASSELNAIIGASEKATNDICEAVELIEETTAEMDPNVARAVGAAVTKVYEACGFQDLTGQRVTKVVNALQSIETKVQAILQAFGEDDWVEARPSALGTAAKQGTTPGSNDYPIAGRRLPDEAISQEDVDALLASFD